MMKFVLKQPVEAIRLAQTTTFQVGNGRNVVGFAGDYMVTLDDGTQHVADGKVFDKLYKQVTP